jgi:hypothetical protein
VGRAETLFISFWVSFYVVLCFFFWAIVFVFGERRLAALELGCGLEFQRPNWEVMFEMHTGVCSFWFFSILDL